MKIGVVGCGALGSYYGARLSLAGQDVHFLLRSDYGAVRRDGVRVRSVAGDFHARPACAVAPEEVGVCDLVVIGLKTTANDQFARLLTPLVGDGTAIVTLQNGLGNEAALAGLFGGEKILGGLCFVCLNRTAPGHIEHTAHGLIVLGEHRRPAGPRTQQLATVLRDAGIPCETADDLERAHWEKLVWNIPFNGLGVASAAGYEAVRAGAWPAELRPGPCLATDRLLADPQWLALVRELMHEVIAAAQALGFAVPASAAEVQIVRTREMGAYRASTLIDFERGQPLEIESLFGEPLRQAAGVGVATPRLAALVAVLRQLEARCAPRATA